MQDTDFLNTPVKFFEWRRDGSYLMIHWSGNDVILGTHHNYGTCYIGKFFGAIAHRRHEGVD